MLTPAQRASFARVNTERDFREWLAAEAAKTAITLRTASDATMIYRAQGRSSLLEELQILLKTASGT
jgi:hypothetical protein